MIGREFSYEVIAQVVSEDEEVLAAGLERLVESELVFRRGLEQQTQYRFKHALVQEVAYQSLRPRTRQGYHARIAQVLTEHFPETVSSQPELLAHHYTEAGEDEVAVTYWQQAGLLALKHSANLEAIAHLTKGLDLVARRPETTVRQRQEQDLQIALGTALMNTKGYASPDMERVFARAQVLCEQTGDISQLITVLGAVQLYHLSAGDLPMVAQLGEQMLRLAQAQGQPDPAFFVLSHHNLGIGLFYQGELTLALARQQEVIAIYTTLPTPQDLIMRFGAEFGALCYMYMALALWLLGYADQARQHFQMARTLAQEMSEAQALANVLAYTACFHQFHREAPVQEELAADTIALAIEEGFALWRASGTILHGSAQAMQGQIESGIDEMRQGIDAYQATGSKSFRPYHLSLLAVAYGEWGQAAEGLRLLDEAIEVVDTTEARFYEAELYRLKGELLLGQVIPDTSQAEACFHRALDIARSQAAKSLELRTAISLARLWQSQGKPSQARELLEPVYTWFSEGFDTADLIDARTLLDALEAER